MLSNTLTQIFHIDAFEIGIGGMKEDKGGVEGKQGEIRRERAKGRDLEDEERGE